MSHAIDDTIPPPAPTPRALPAPSRDMTPEERIAIALEGIHRELSDVRELVSNVATGQLEADTRLDRLEQGQKRIESHVSALAGVVDEHSEEIERVESYVGGIERRNGSHG